MKKISYEYILLFMQILFIALFVLVMLAHNLDIAEKDFLERRMVSENVKGIQYGDARVDENVRLEIPEIENTDFMLYKRLAEGFDIWRGVYGTKDIFGLGDYIEQGRFFGSEDYKNKTKTVVVGQDILPQTFEKNGKQYYPYNQEFYEVIGIFKSTGKDLDHTIYLNLTALLETEDHMAAYYVGAENSDEVSRVLDVLQEEAQNKYGTQVMEYESSLEYVGLGNVGEALLVAAISAAFFNMLITVIFFVTNKKYKVAIQKLCGMTGKDLAWSYGKKIFLIMLLAFTAVLLIINFLARYLGNLFTLEKLMNYHYVVMGLLMLPIGVITTLFIAGLARGINISDALKGK